jgi:hypothetical protein
MIKLLEFFLGAFIPMFLFWTSLFFIVYVLYTFLKCIRKGEKLSENVTKKDNFYFFLSISYIFTFIFIWNLKR